MTPTMPMVTAPPDFEPVFAEGHFALANWLHAQGRKDEAATACRRALDLMPGFTEALWTLANLMQEQGDGTAAAALYRHALVTAPGFAAAWCNLGSALKARSRSGDAIRAYRRAADLLPGFLEAHYNLGVVCQESGHPEEAEAAYRRVLAMKPDHAEALSNLGTLFKTANRLDAAAAFYRLALAIEPGHTLARYNLGTVFQEQGRPDEAAVAYRRVLRIDPGFALAHYNLGTVLQEQGRLEEAAEAYRDALRASPGYADACYNLGILHQSVGRLDEAAAAYADALRLSPHHIDSLSNLGTVFQEQGRLDEAAAAYAGTLRLDPGYRAARNNLGTVLVDQGRLEEAVAVYGDAATVHPDFPEARWNLSLVRLLQGDFETGWREYEWRWKTPDYGKDARPFEQPRWAGEPGGGRTILLHAEQGMGDTIQFVRYVPEVAARGWRVVLEVQGALRGLLATLEGAAMIVTRGEPLPPFDVHCPLLSLPHVFGTTLQTILRRIPYLAADPAAVARWRDRLAGVGPGGLRVGMVWAGNPHHRNDRNRSIPLARLLPFLAGSGRHLFSLQKEPRPGDREALAAHGVVDLGPELGDFTDTAAVLEALDLLVSVDTSVAHLAGALGRPTWVLLPTVPDWRWLMEREDSPWYPSLRLFRQTAAGDWDGVLARLAGELARTGADPLPA